MKTVRPFWIVKGRVITAQRASPPAAGEVPHRVLPRHDTSVDSLSRTVALAPYQHTTLNDPSLCSPPDASPLPCEGRPMSHGRWNLGVFVKCCLNLLVMKMKMKIKITLSVKKIHS